MRINKMISSGPGERQSRHRGSPSKWTILGNALLTLITVLLLSGCGLFGKENLKEWVGFHREEVIRVMGPPTKETSLPDGTTQLDFIQRITKHPSAAQQYGASYVCRRTFVIDPEGFVIDAWKEGC